MSASRFFIWNETTPLRWIVGASGGSGKAGVFPVLHITSVPLGLHSLARASQKLEQLSVAESYIARHNNGMGV
jgi:hypothetical protein